MSAHMHVEIYSMSAHMHERVGILLKSNMHHLNRMHRHTKKSMLVASIKAQVEWLENARLSVLDLYNVM